MFLKSNMNIRKNVATKILKKVMNRRKNVTTMIF